MGDLKAANTKSIVDNLPIELTSEGQTIAYIIKPDDPDIIMMSDIAPAMKARIRALYQLTQVGK